MTNKLVKVKCLRCGQVTSIETKDVDFAHCERDECLGVLKPVEEVKRAVLTVEFASDAELNELTNAIENFVNTNRNLIRSFNTDFILGGQ